MSAEQLWSKFDSAPLFVVHEGALVPAKQWPCSAQQKELEDPQAWLGASIKRGPDLYDARTVFEAELEDATRTTPDACAVLESGLQ